jgi:hypothetical protein
VHVSRDATWLPRGAPSLKLRRVRADATHAMRILPVAAALVMVAALLASRPARPQPQPGGASCQRPDNQQTTLAIDGELYALVRERRPVGYLAGWSGSQVRALALLARVAKPFGVTGRRQLLDLPPIEGGVYGPAGSTGYFDLRCSGTFRAIVLVRRGGLVGLQLQEERGLRQLVLRSFCLPARRLPKGALVSVAFHAPLRATAPAFRVDRDGDGRADAGGRLRPGGARFVGPAPSC